MMAHAVATGGGTVSSVLSGSSNQTTVTNQLVSQSTGDALGAILGHVVAVAVIAGLLYATAETPAYPVAVGIVLVALVYVLLGNSTGVSRLAGDITSFAKL